LENSWRNPVPENMARLGETTSYIFYECGFFKYDRYIKLLQLYFPDGPIELPVTLKN
jgi:hypothetical protein